MRWAHTKRKYQNKESITLSSHLDLSFSGWGNAELFPLFCWCFVSLKELKLVANFRCFHLYVLNKITRSYNIWRRLAQKNCLEMSYKDDNLFDRVHRTANAVHCDTAHRFYQDFLLSKYHAVVRYMCNHNFIFATKKGKAFSVPTVTASKNAEQDHAQMSYVEFRPNRAIHVGGKGKGHLWVLQHCCLEAYCTLTQMSSFIHLQRRCTHQAAWQTSASEGRNYTWNLASNP